MLQPRLRAWARVSLATRGGWAWPPGPGGLGGGAAGADDRRTVEEFQDAGKVHRAPSGGTGRGGQVLPGKEGLGAASQE